MDQLQTKKYRLPRKFAQEWITILRSGEFSQGKGTLRRSVVNHANGDRTYQYCCLGVACSLLLKENIGMSAISGHAGPFEFADHVFEENFDDFPEELKGRWQDYKELGLSVDRFLAKTDNNLANVLMHLNDVYDYDFNQIANWIEQNVEFYD